MSAQDTILYHEFEYDTFKIIATYPRVNLSGANPIYAWDSNISVIVPGDVYHLPVPDHQQANYWQQSHIWLFIFLFSFSTDD